ncbi:hypothetical protein VTK26DRAFT_7696 [Humicola hyalothermophila]
MPGVHVYRHANTHSKNTQSQQHKSFASGDKTRHRRLSQFQHIIGNTDVLPEPSTSCRVWGSGGQSSVRNKPHPQPSLHQEPRARAERGTPLWTHVIGRFLLIASMISRPPAAKSDEVVLRSSKVSYVLHVYLLQLDNESSFRDEQTVMDTLCNLEERERVATSLDWLV